MQTIFLTGADGLLGSNLCRVLLDRGYRLRILQQAGRHTGTLDGLALDVVVGDLSDRATLQEAVAGCDAVIHVAAITNTWPSRGEIYWQVNVEGTRNLAEAVLAAKVPRMLCVGSASSLGFGTKGQPGTEQTPFVSDRYGLDYIDSKRAAHVLLEQYVAERGLPAMILCPTFMIGPYDAKPSSGAMIMAIAERRMPVMPLGGKNWVYVQDVAYALANALTRGRIGETYLLGHENLSYPEALRIIAEEAGTRPPRLGMPGSLLRGAGWMASKVSRFTGKQPAFSYEMARIAADGHYFSPAKAVAELDMPQTGLRHAVREALTWFRAHGYLPGNQPGGIADPAVSASDRPAPMTKS
jgi:dihydroflavonol-4-reductase